MSEKRIFIVDDDADLVKIISEFLKQESYRVYSSLNPKEALKQIAETMPDLVLLDVRMKEMSGLDVCRALKADPKTRNILVVILSVKADVADVVVGLELGAEDYIRKPIQKEELVARVKAVMRRTVSETKPERLEIGPLVIDYLTYTATINGKTLDLRPKEFELLAYLARREGQLVTRQSLSENVWGREHVPTSRTIEDHMYRVRKHLGDQGHWIRGFKGVGYRFEVD